MANNLLNDISNLGKIRNSTFRAIYEKVGFHNIEDFISKTKYAINVDELSNMFLAIDNYNGYLMAKNDTEQFGKLSILFGVYIKEWTCIGVERITDGKSYDCERLYIEYVINNEVKKVFINFMIEDFPEKRKNKPIKLQSELDRNIKNNNQKNKITNKEYLLKSIMISLFYSVLPYVLFLLYGKYYHVSVFQLLEALIFLPKYYFIHVVSLLLLFLGFKSLLFQNLFKYVCYFYCILLLISSTCLLNKIIIELFDKELLKFCFNFI